jgi:hypothetical protein
VNDPPSFTAANPVVTVAESSGQYRAPLMLNLSSGPQENDWMVACINCSSSTPGLFSAAPEFLEAGVLTFTPTQYASGSSDCTVSLFETRVFSGTERLSTNSSLRIVVTEGESMACAAGQCSGCIVPAGSSTHTLNVACTATALAEQHAVLQHSSAAGTV